MKKVAIFDIDGTVFRSSLLIETTNMLIAGKVFPEKTGNFYRQAYENWANRLDSYDKYINAVVQAFEQNIKGVKRADLRRIVRKTIALHKYRVYRYTRDLVKKLKAQEYYLLAISHSPKDIVEEFAKHLGFDMVYGRIFEVGKDGKFTGKILYADIINDKAKSLKFAIKKEKLVLKGSIGLGDSEGDIAFLKMVERPICFNPNSILYRQAKRAKWEIVVERKDVVYKI